MKLNTFAPVALAAAMLSLAACGGGGGSKPAAMTPAPETMPEAAATPAFAYEAGSLGEAARRAALASAEYGSVYQSSSRNMLVEWAGDPKGGSLVIYGLGYGDGTETTLVPALSTERSCASYDDSGSGGGICQVSKTTDDYLFDVRHIWGHGQSFAQGWWVDIGAKQVGVFLVDESNWFTAGGGFDATNFPRSGTFADYDFDTQGRYSARTEGAYVWQRSEDALHYGRATGTVTMTLSGGSTLSGSVAPVLGDDQNGVVPTNTLASRTFTLTGTLNRNDGRFTGTVGGAASGSFGGQAVHTHGHMCFIVGGCGDGVHSDLQGEVSLLFGTVGLTDITAHDGLSVLLAYELID